MNITFNTYPTTTMPSVCAGPFTISFSARPIACCAEYELSLCAYNSNSYSHFSVANEDRLYLIPRWRFLDTDFNIISSIPITNIVSSVDGITGSASFYYIDDMPSSAVNINVEINNILNFPVSSCNVNDITTTTVASAMVSLYVGEWEPTIIKYTSDGINDIDNKWTEHPIKWYATLHPYEDGPIIFSYNYSLTTSLLSSTNLMPISNMMCPITANIYAFDKQGNYGWASGECLTLLSADNAIFYGNLSSGDTITIFNKNVNISQDFGPSNYSNAQFQFIDLESPLLSGVDYTFTFRGTNNNVLSSNAFITGLSSESYNIFQTYPVGFWAADVDTDYSYTFTSPRDYDKIGIGLGWTGANPPPSFLVNPNPPPLFISYSIDYSFNFKAVKLVTSISSLCNEFKIRPFEQPFEIRRFNESWDATKSIKSYAMAPHLNSKYNLWDNFIGHSVGQLSAGQQLGRKSYERIANFPANHIDIDESNIKQLYSLSQYLDVPIDDYDLNYPPELQRLIDIGSISHSKLWGEIVKCNLNITDNQICPRCGYKHNNLGDMIEDPFNYTLTAGVPFIQHDRFNTSPDGWTIEYPPLLIYNDTPDWKLQIATNGFNWNRALAISKNGAYQAAVCNNGIYYSTDYGITWNINPAIMGSTANGMAISSDAKYQVVMNGNIYVSNDTGQTWTNRTGDPDWPPYFGSFGGKAAMSGSGQYITIVGVEGVWVSNDYGDTWHKTYTETTWVAVDMNESGSYQLIGRSGGSNKLILESTDYGESWQSAGLSMIQCRAIAVSDDGNIRLAIGTRATSSPSYIYINRNNTGWIATNPIGYAQPIDGHYEGIGISGDGNYIESFIQAGTMYRSIYSEDYGYTWTYRDIGPGTTLRSNVALNSNGVYRITTNGDGLWISVTLIDVAPIYISNKNLCELSATNENNYVSIYPFTQLTAISTYDLNFCSHYDFYEYKDGFPFLETCDPLDPRHIQAAGVINRNDEYNTLKVESLSSVEDWFGDEGKLQEIIEYELLRGLQLSTQTCSISS